MRLAWTILALVVAAFAMGQGAAKVPYKPYKSGAYSQVRELKVIPIRSQAALARYWASASPLPGEAVPTDVDFRRNELLAIHLGERSTGGHAVYVDTVEKTNRPGVIKVHIVEQRPGGGMVTQAITSPFVIVRLPRSNARYVVERTIDATTGANPDPRPVKPGPADSEPKAAQGGACACCEPKSGGR